MQQPIAKVNDVPKQLNCLHPTWRHEVMRYEFVQAVRSRLEHQDPKTEFWFECDSGLGTNAGPLTGNRDRKIKMEFDEHELLMIVAALADYDDDTECTQDERTQLRDKCASPIRELF